MIRVFILYIPPAGYDQNVILYIPPAGYGQNALLETAFLKTRVP